MRVQVVVGERRLMIPVKEGCTVKWLLEESCTRANAGAATHLVTEQGFELYANDLVCMPVDEKTINHMCASFELCSK